MRYVDNVLLSNTTNCLTQFLEILKNLNIPKNKRGPNNIVELEVATAVAVSYNNILGQKPTTAKNKDNPKKDSYVKTTPYDRILQKDRSKRFLVVMASK